ncbi:MAG: hypothetical protein MJ220_03845 [Bacilli bacterium]|nr:hypothetical protein [Bacilli bacterium]
MKKDLTLPTLVSVVVLLAFSSVGATYAWYQYNANVVIDYNGTSIGSSTVFEVGLVSETPLIGYEDYGLVREQIGDKDVYWCASEVTTNISKYYLSSNGYATNSLNGTTSGRFQENDEFSLKRNPVYLDDYVKNSDSSTYKYALKSNYAHFELAFKVNVITLEGVTTEQTSKVSLKSADLDSDGDLYQAIRIHFSSSDSSLIFNPSSSTNGEDVVGGVLDLNNDGAYDSRTLKTGDHEYVYGEYDNIVYSSEPESNGINPVLLTGDGNAFVAEHRNGVYTVDVEKSTFAKSSYLGTEEIISKKRILSKTDVTGIAYLGMDIYLEGWSQAFTNAELNHLFGLGLEFECK